jgi:predicted metal-dependent TIM-barrel fold hydrolase
MDSPPRVFDAHLHPEALSDQDLETMRFFGVEAAVVVAHHAPVEATAQALLGHFDALLARQLPRLERAGIHAWAALGVHPQRIPRRGLGEVLTALPGYFRGGKVVALGETGFHQGTDAEEECFTEHAALARRLGLPLLVHTPQRAKDSLTRRTLALLKGAGLTPEAVLVDHADARTLQVILGCGYFAGLTLHPDALSAEQALALIRKVGAERVVLDTDSGDGASDILGLPRAVSLLPKGKLSATLGKRVSFQNAAAFFRVAA